MMDETTTTTKNLQLDIGRACHLEEQNIVGKTF